MLELLILYKLCTRIGNSARAKGRQAIGYQLMLIGFWFAGELSAGLVAAVTLAILFGEEVDGFLLPIYLAGFIGAGVGAWVAFLIVGSLSRPGRGSFADPAAEYGPSPQQVTDHPDVR
jgi:hypothetical protein